MNIISRHLSGRELYQLSLLNRFIIQLELPLRCWISPMLEATTALLKWGRKKKTWDVDVMCYCSGTCWVVVRGCVATCFATTEVASGLLILFVHWSWTRHSWFPTCCEEVLSQYVQHNYVQEEKTSVARIAREDVGRWPKFEAFGWIVVVPIDVFCTFKTDQTLLFKRNLELPPPGKNSEAWMASGKMLGLPPDRWTTRPGPVHILRWLHNPMTIDLVTRDKHLNLNWFDDAFDQSISDWSFQNLLLFSRERIHDDVSQWLQLHWCKIQVGTLRKWQNPWFRRYFCFRQLFSWCHKEKRWIGNATRAEKQDLAPAWDATKICWRTRIFQREAILINSH